jgi:hypothetical protein
MVVMALWRSLGCLTLLFPSIPALAFPSAMKSGTIEKGCRTHGEVKLCFHPPTRVSLFVGGKRTNLLTTGADESLPYEIQQRDRVYRVKIGFQESWMVPFYMYKEIVFRKAGSGFRVTRYAVTSETECEGGPNVRILDAVDLAEGTITTILAPPWTTDGKEHRWGRTAKPKSTDLFRLSDDDFIALWAEPPLAPDFQQYCSA